MGALRSVKKPANLTLDSALLEEARALGLNISAARAARWQTENAEALASSNAWVQANGLPLARYQPF
jgi:antitoxin CcdA